MTLAQRFDRLLDNRVHAVEVPCQLMGAQRFRKGDWVALAEGRVLLRVWGLRYDTDTIFLY